VRVLPSPRVVGLAACPHGSVSDAEVRSLGLEPASVLDFSASINPCGPSPRVRDAIARTDISRYPDDDASALRRALARRLDASPEAIMVGNGSVELIWLLAVAYLDPGDTVLVVRPTFGEYERAARIAGAQVLCWRAEPCNGFRPDVAAIASLIVQSRPKLVFLCSPNNPTGAHLDRSEIERIVEASGSGLVVLDEAYRGFVEAPAPMLDLVAGGQVVLLRSLTKEYALAGLRLGYAVAAPDVIEHLRAVRPPWTVNAAAQAAGMAALDDEAHLARARAEVRAAKAYLEEELGRLGLAAAPSAANFLLVEVGDGAAFRGRLLRQGCCVRDCASFGLPAHVRIGIRTRPECERLVAAMAEVVEVARAR
jgi:histidinol-phosphate aminotransferase